MRLRAISNTSASGGKSLNSETIILRTTVATVAAIAGALAGATSASHRRIGLPLLVHAAAGVLLAVTFFDILPDAKAHLSWSQLVLATASGTVLFAFITRYVSQMCPACSSDAHRSSAAIHEPPIWILMLALGVHSTMDGLAIATADSLSHSGDLAILLGVAVHKIPEGLALCLLLIAGGYSPLKAFIASCVVESATMLGGLLGISLLAHAPVLTLSLLFAHIGGGFVFLVSTTFAPHLKDRTRSLRRSVAIPAIAGFATTAVILLSLKG